LIDETEALKPPNIMMNRNEKQKDLKQKDRSRSEQRCVGKTAIKLVGLSSGVQKRGANGAPTPGIQGKGASKEWNYKNLNAVTRCFFLL